MHAPTTTPEQQSVAVPTPPDVTRPSPISSSQPEEATTAGKTEPLPPAQNDATPWFFAWAFRLLLMVALLLAVWMLLTTMNESQAVEDNNKLGPSAEPPTVLVQTE